MKNILKNPKANIAAEWLVLALLVVFLAYTLWQIVFSLESLKLEGNFGRVHRHRFSAGPKIAPDQIRGWMTFRYINVAFNLPPSYLKDVLYITDRRYPNLSVDALAKARKTDPKAVLLKDNRRGQKFFGKV